MVCATLLSNVTQRGKQSTSTECPVTDRREFVGTEAVD